ncbi:hypothetical protein QVD17_00883 [Tagetes erecta]|uniref:Shugoshin C-terminal domain-containing protein n=1 Tax=Tagetes erecta TaxID=13708 RepID=A0AAD8P695_TARER|nr:hypothetical protein QVD17_00883 [Tagetes erecta]
MAKTSSFGKSIRKRLSDITNYQPQHKSSPVFHQNFPLDDSSSPAKQQIDRLVKENQGLLKLITDKNKVIETNGVELQNLRIVVQKTRLQNWNLAQSNSHMMAELNLGKKKLKELQHQLACKDALLKTMKLDLQAKHETNVQKCESKDGEKAVVIRQNTDKQLRPGRSQSIGHMTKVEVSEEEMLENKRRRVRRQSARFTSQHNEPDENLFEIKDLKMHEDYGPLSNMINEQKQDKCRSESEPQGSQRMSFGRPSRKAAEKIHSYKETPLNIKMRRPE